MFKIGFHTGPAGNPTGIGAYFQQLDAAGKAAVQKSVDNYGPCHELATLARASGVPHVIMFRLSGGALELPNYDNDPQAEAAAHWARITAALPPEFDKDLVWLEVINEPDKNRADWIGRFLFHVSEKSRPAGFKLCGPSWSTGEPEAAHWLLPGWRDYLAACAADPSHVAIALHEYSLTVNHLTNEPSLVGRFSALFDAADQLGLARPNVLVTEFGWTHDTVPASNPALTHLTAAANLYAAHPQILGAGIWYLGGGFGDIANLTQPLIAPLTNLALNFQPSTPPVAGPQPSAPGRGHPRAPYARAYRLLHPSLGDIDAINVFRLGQAQRRTVGYSFDDAAIGNLASRTIEIFGCPPAEQAANIDFFAQFYPGVSLRFFLVNGDPASALIQLPAASNQPLGAPRVQYDRNVWVLHPALTDAQAVSVFRQGLADRRTVTYSFDDAGLGDLDQRTAEIWGCPQAEQAAFQSWYAQHYPGVLVAFRQLAEDTDADGLDAPIGTPEERRRSTVWPGRWEDVNPYGRVYELRANVMAIHTGADLNLNFPTFDLDRKAPVYAIGRGTVTSAKTESGSWGQVVIARHDLDGERFYSRYAHLDSILVARNQVLERGTQLGTIGRPPPDGAFHLHFDVSPTEVLAADPADWPGLDQSRINRDYVEPRAFIEARRPDRPPVVVVTSNEYHGPAIAGLFFPGVDQPAADFRWPQAKAVFEVTGLRPKFHSGGINHTFFGQFRHPAFNIVRIIVNRGFTNRDPNAIFNEMKDAPRPYYDAGQRDFILLNEPNTEHEHLGKLWDNGTQFGATFLTLCQKLRAEYPGVRLWFPGCSPGFGAQHTFINAAKAAGAFNLLYGVVEHVYTGITNNAAAAADQMVAEVHDFQQRHALDRPLVIGEFSVNRPAAGAYKADVYHRFANALGQIKGVQSAYSFTSSWFGDPNSDANQEGWLEHGIHTAW